MKNKKIHNDLMKLIFGELQEKSRTIRGPFGRGYLFQQQIKKLMQTIKATRVLYDLCALSQLILTITLKGKHNLYSQFTREEPGACRG